MNELFEHCMKVAADKVRSYRDFWHGAPDAVNKGTPPPPPDWSEVNREGIEAAIRYLPAQKVIEGLAYKGGSGSVQLPDGETINVDFSGFGDLDRQEIEMESMRRSSEALAQMQLDIQQRFGREMNLEQIARIKEADPIGYELRQQLAQVTLDELGKGSELGEKASREVEQSVRGGQAARGNVYGSANIGQEALAKFDVGQRLLTQRLAQAQSYALGTPITAQYGSIAGAQQGAAAFTPMQAQQGIGMNPNAGAQAAQFAAGNYSTYVQGLANRSNPWMEGLGIVGGIAAQAAGGWAGAAAFTAANAAARGGGASSVQGPGGQHFRFQGNSGPAYTAMGW